MSLAIYTHPTLTVLVDDSDSFLKSVSFQLDPRLASKTFHDTSSALGWLLQNSRNNQPGDLALQVNFDTQNLSSDHCSVAIDIEGIYRISASPQRFLTPSVLVVDYSMPQMNGLEFCQAVEHLPCKKIMFTGAADEKIAVDAFNRGLIDRYIKKSEDGALDRLESEIGVLQKAFFAEQSDTFRDLLVLHHYHFLSDPAIAGLVQALMLQHGFVEHYIFPSPTGILFFDAHGKARLMIVETVTGMRAQFEMARDSEAPPSLLAALQECRVIPFFGGADGDGMYSQTYGSNWHRYCQAPEICQGRETYFWALFDLPAHYLQGPVFSYGQFLSQHRAADAGPAPQA
ncbi:MAG TPA: response regulator [Janthinobacterium sp.]|nr:response regulator [Janthinobacterium sp.]